MPSSHINGDSEKYSAKTDEQISRGQLNSSNYILWFVLFLFLIISLKDRGCCYMLYMFILALALIFLVIWEFSKKTWARKTAGYIIFVASIFIWYAGFGRLMNYVYSIDSFPLVSPYW